MPRHVLLALHIAFVIAALSVTGCGRVDFSGKGLSPSKIEGKTAASPASPSASANATPSVPDPNYAMVVDDSSKAPACDAGSEGRLIYVLASKTFETCHDSAYVAIDITGPQGPAGPAGAAGDSGSPTGDAAALAVYKASRRSVYRVTVACGGATPSMQWGSAFRCSATQVCTNAHVVTCTGGAPLTSFKLEEVQATVDTTGDLKGAPADDGSTHPGFFSTTKPTITLHPSRDLAKVVATGFAADAPVLKLPSQDFTHNEAIFTEILSMSYPLAFEDLYSSLGEVITPYLGDCNATGTNTSKYGCVRQSYDFATTNPTDHGSSGSPLFNVDTGEVIGVTSAGPDQENANYTWAIDAFEFTKF